MQSQLLVVLAAQVIDNSLNRGEKNAFGEIFFRIRNFVSPLINPQTWSQLNHLEEAHF